MKDTGNRQQREDETLLVEKARSGEQEAFEMLVNRYRSEIYNLAYRISGNHHHADDIAQETFIKAFLALKKFRGASTFKTWIYSIALNTARTIASREAKSKKIELPLLEGVVPQDHDPGHVASRMASEELFRKAIDHMPERQKEVLLLKVFHEMKHTEIARALGISTGAAKANFFHAMKFLKNAMRGRSENDSPVSFSASKEKASNGGDE